MSHPTKPYRTEYRDADGRLVAAGEGIHWGLAAEQAANMMSIALDGLMFRRPFTVHYYDPDGGEIYPLGQKGDNHE